ncbi:hypothetical protein [Flavobacterium degerlachei]|uniref:Uncharacterized protein n=1 Tax=Flavobacterium degerlachei TaxID=229203 RepID=A0A1H3EA09_9FLAO|nr:hypothetical protein [Flavobacterium degerlachei]SDX75521.1 hypothetical protein SAMN05444338_11487 [Flavobacterium degerlachei]
MTTIAILKDGTPIRIHLFDNPIFDVDGFLVQFTTPDLSHEVYRYFHHSEFKAEDRKKPDLSGYYNEAIFLNYIQNIEPVPTMKLLVKYDFERNLATENEEITVSTVDFNEPFENFFNYKKYTFNLQRTLDQKGVRKYLKTIFENLKIIGYKINTDEVNGIVELHNESALPSGYFYKKNFGDFVNSWLISDLQKSDFKKLMTLIVFKIKEINKDIIPIIATNTNLFNRETDVSNGNLDYNGLPDFEKFFFDLKRSWGYYYDTPLEGYPRPYKDDFDAIFSSFSTYNDYLLYYNGLVNFYERCYIEKNLAFRSEDKKLQFLLEILPPSALGILPYSYIINAITGLLRRKLEEDDQRFLVRLVLSITASYANDFLDFLLEKGNGAQTNFETIYESLTDGRLERYTFVNWFVNEQTNRKYFAFAVFELWKVSKYNLGHIPPGVTPIGATANFQGVDPNGYFVLNENEFNKNNYLTFSSSESSFLSKQVFFESTINGKNIKINKITTEDSNLDHIHNRTSTLFGSFHLYQQVLFSGFEANLDLKIPKTATIPAFLFHFIEEFDRIADFDAAISLAIDLTTDVLLAYFTGGAGVLADLHYLKYTTQLGRALTGGLEATKAVEVWRGLEVGSEVFTLTAGSLVQINTYLITTENNEDKRKILEGYQKVLLPLLFLGAGVSIAARAHAVREAERVLASIEALPSGVAHGLSLDAMNLLTTLKGEKTVALTTFGNKLNTLDLGGATNTIISKYNTLFTDAQKLKFWNDFQGIDDPAFWKLLNSGKGVDNILNGKYIENWISLSERGLTEAKFTDYICVQNRTNNIIRFVDEASIKPVLGTLSYERKLNFLDTFGDVDATNFAKFVDEPKLVSYWGRYYDDLILRPNFVSLSNAKKIKWLGKYGDLSTDLYNQYLKANPDAILSWSKYSDEADLLAELNKYTKEEQLIFFKDYPHTNIVSFNKFKTDPSLLVIERNYIKAYVQISKGNYLFNTNLDEVFAIYNEHGKKLYLKVEEDFLVTKSSGLSKKYLEKITLKSGFSHKDYPDLIILRDNIHKTMMDDFIKEKNWFRTDNSIISNNLFDIDKIKSIYAKFEIEEDFRTIHPWLEKRINIHLEKRISNTWKIDIESISRTGHIPGTHAEIRALNELLWRLQNEKGLIITDDIVNDILGYNKNYSTIAIMPRCGDCFFITKDFKMIMSN